MKWKEKKENEIRKEKRGGKKRKEGRKVIKKIKETKKKEGTRQKGNKKRGGGSWDRYTRSVLQISVRLWQVNMHSPTGEPHTWSLVISLMCAHTHISSWYHWCVCFHVRVSWLCLHCPIRNGSLLPLCAFESVYAWISTAGDPSVKLAEPSQDSIHLYLSAVTSRHRPLTWNNNTVTAGTEQWQQGRERRREKSEQTEEAIKWVKQGKERQTLKERTWAQLRVNNTLNSDRRKASFSRTHLKSLIDCCCSPLVKQLWIEDGSRRYRLSSRRRKTRQLLFVYLFIHVYFISDERAIRLAAFEQSLMYSSITKSHTVRE